MHNPKNGNFEFWKKGDNALLKMIESPDLEEVNKYGRDYNKREQELYGTFGWSRNSEGQVPVDSGIYQGQGNNGSGASRTQETESETISTGSGRFDNGYNNETERNRIDNIERSTENGGALSDAQNSTIRGLEDDFLSKASPEELEDIESEFDRRMALQDDRIMCLRELIYRTLFSYVARTLIFAVLKYISL